jgi:hypothetical protein
MYIQRLSIRNLRSIAEAELTFDLPGDGPGNITLLLGGNGAGKTSILRAVALACLGPALASSGFLPYRLVRESARARGKKPALCELDATVALTRQDGTDDFRGASALTLTTAIERWGKDAQRRERLGDITAALADGKPADLSKRYAEALFRADLSRYVVIGYGATRRIEATANVDSAARSKSRGPRYQRVAGLFEEGVTLMPLAFWLPAYQARNPGRAKQVATLINKLLPKGCQFLPKVQETETGPEFLFRIDGTAVPFGALSDGFRAYVGWVADMLYHVTQGAASGHRLDETEGIVLIDEIDLHLHPEWQREVLPTLGQALPNMQFIVSSHSALVTASLNQTQVRVLRGGNEGTAVKELGESLEGRSVDQILRSPYFGLESSRSVATQDKLRALSQKAADGDVQASLDYMRQLAGTDTSPAR